MSTTKIVHGYRSKIYNEVMVCSLTEKHTKDNLISMIKYSHPKSWKTFFDRNWEYFTMEVEFPDGSNLDDRDD